MSFVILNCMKSYTKECFYYILFSPVKKVHPMIK